MKFIKTLQHHLFSQMILLASLIILAVFPTTTSAQDNQITLNIPSLEVSASIVEIGIKQFPDNSVSWDTSNLGMNVGHLEGTAWLDAPGNIVLGAHSELAERTPGIFYTLDQISIGDSIELAHAGETRQYTVTQIYLADTTDLTPIYPTSSDRLTLITCDTGSYSTATGAYNQRLIVVAERSA